MIDTMHAVLAAIGGKGIVLVAAVIVVTFDDLRNNLNSLRMK